jgi:hypothetical protein
VVLTRLQVADRKNEWLRDAWKLAPTAAVALSREMGRKPLAAALGTTTILRAQDSP